ncbi:MAG: hypothetical protein JST44_08650 [Cyanobacteria bacterium SZAS LIN-5]|nr:hypothetical protein [Cyanobacteria bacterium SZAS LIN-5]
MSQKDSSSKIKAQPGAPGTGKRAGSTKYKMQAAQLAQEAAKIAAQQEAQAKAQKEAAARGESQSEDTVRGLWKSRVLASYKSKGAKDSNTLLAKISDGKAALEVGDRHKSANVQEVMVSTVDKMFDVFQNCAYEFNKIAAGTELEINWIRPFLSKEVTANWQQQEHANLIFSGRVSTRRWTMVVKGTVEEVVVFILPADKLIGFALSANNFKPYFTMIPISENLDVRWQIEEHIMPPELFHNIYKELFNGLIRFAREEAHPDEVFTLRQIGIEIPTENEQAKKEEEIARQKAYQDAFFQDMRSRDDFQTKQVPEFAKPELPRQLPTPGAQGVGSGSSSGWKQVPDSAAHNADNARLMAERNRPIQPITPEAAPKPQPVIPQQAPPLPQMHPQPQPQPQPHMSSTMTPQWPSLQQQPVAPQPPLPQVQPSAPVAPQPMMPQVPPVVPSPPKFPQPQYPQAMQFPQQQPPQAPPYQQPAPPPQPVRPATFPEALSALLGTLDQELEVVAKAGSDAFAQRDLARADAALKFSGRLSEFRTLARELWEYYGGGSKPQ